MQADTAYKFLPVGDCAVLVTFGDRVDLKLNRQVHALASAVVNRQQNGVGIPTPGYATLLIPYDPLMWAYQDLSAWLQDLLADLPHAAEQAGRLVEIPTTYGGEGGPDLDFVARYNQLSPLEVVRIHSSVIYPVYLMGFTPGFPYLGGMDAAIAAPRLETPRKMVRAGSVGIAGEQTGIYSVDSPGGWRIIGRSDVRLFDLGREEPFLLAPGDRVRFVPINPGDLKND